MAKRETLSARIVVEANVEDMARTRGYVVSALKNACKNTRDGTVLITIYDENDRIIGADLSGVPTEDLQESFDDLIDKLEAQAPRVVPRPPQHQVRSSHPQHSD